MSEANLTALDGGKKPKIEVRMPTFKDGMNFVGVIAAGDAGDALAVLDSGSGKISEAQMQAAFLAMMQGALRNRATRDEFLGLMADLWVYEPPRPVLDADAPPEDWEYDPRLDLVEKGQAIGREEMWRSLSTRQKKRLVKRVELENYPLNLVGEFVDAFKRMPYVADFLGSLGSSEKDGDGSSSTDSPDDTAGATQG